MFRSLVLLTSWACSLASMSCKHAVVASVAAPMDAIPCDVAGLLKQHCVECHGSMPRRGAPLSLLTASAFRAPRDNLTVGQVALARVQNDARPMPPAPNARLTASEVATLTTWIESGAPEAAPGCPVEDVASAPASDAATTTVVADAGSRPVQSDSGSQVARVDAGGAADAGAVSSDAGQVAPDDRASKDWSAFGHDLANTRASPSEHVLSSTTVHSLRRLWELKGPASTSTPAIIDGTVYLPCWDGKVRALRAEDGGMLWTSVALPNKVDTAPLVIDSSPAVTATEVFVSDNNGGVHALERASGKVLWSVAVDMHPQAHLWSSPMYIAGEELTQAPSAGYSFRGSVVGLSAADGKEKWRFHTADAASSGPGVAVWATAAVDPARKALYIGTGNNYAAPASSLADSLLALDFQTGKLLWSMQFTKNDLFTIFAMDGGPDSDVGSTANLFSVGGHDLVGVGIKNGTYVALERDSGTMRWMTMLTSGSVLGGVISASAYADETIYVASNGGQQTTVFALDANDGKLRWMSAAQPNTLTYGGLAYANGVVYWATEAGTILALDAASGKQLWSDKASDSIAGGPSVANGVLFVSWGYQWTLLDDGMPGTGGLIAYGL
jgi:polyvinyl alcohol dehydrogenase (cytochrome)